MLFVKEEHHGSEKNWILSERTSEREKSYPGTACGKNECVRENRIQMGDGAFPQLRILLQQPKLTLTEHFAENHI